MSDSIHQTGPVIRTQGLTRHFTRHKKTVEAVRGLDLEIGTGELVAFLGPNGAGKSTTLRMLTTLIAPTAGQALVAGCDLLREAKQVRKRIGYVSQAGGADTTSTGRENLMLQARLYGLSKEAASKRTDELLITLELSSFAD